MTTLSTFPITRAQFEGEKIDMAKKEAGWIRNEAGRGMANVKFGPNAGDTLNLWDIVRTMDIGGDDFLYTAEEDALLRTLRDATCIHSYLLNNVIGTKVGITNGNADKLPQNEKLARMQYANLHSMFIGTGYVLSKLEDMAKKVSETRPSNVNMDDFKFLVPEGEIAMRNYLFGKIGTGLKKGKLEKKINDGLDTFNFTITYLKKVQETLLQEKEKYRLLKNLDGQGSVMDDLEQTVFDVDGVHFSGWTYETKKVVAPKLEFKEVKPEEVVGNILAKKHMIRDMQRIALYNFKERKNPILEFGALNWSTLLDGLPGTGKTTMMQMEMTVLKAIADTLGIPTKFWVIDASEKNEYYGKTQQQYRAKLDQTLDTDCLNLVYFDDVDLIIPGGRQTGTLNSADQDVLKLFMDYLAGVGTVFRGNTITRAATNCAANLDDAFRQRFKGKYLIDGPTTEEDCAKLMMIKFSKAIKHGLVDISPGKGIDPTEVAKEYEHILSPQTQKILAEMKVKPNSVTWRDIGRICYQYQQIDPRFTGRFMDNVASNAFIMAADFDLDKEILENRTVFLERPYQEQVGILGGYFTKMKPETIVNELDRYFQSEMRYYKDDEERKIKMIVDDVRIRNIAITRIAEAGIVQPK